MVNRLALAANWNEIAVGVRTPHQVLGVQEPHVVSRRAGTDTAVENDVGGHTRTVVLQRGKASASSSRTGVRNALNGLQRLKIQTVIVAIRNDQVRLVGTTDQLDGQSIHVGLDVRGRDSRATIGHARILQRTPEVERGAVDAAVGAGRRCVRNRSREAGEVLTAVAGAVEVDVATKAVLQLSFRNVHTTVKQVDDRFFAAVLDHFEARNGHSSRILRDAELSSRNGRVLRDVQNFVARIAVGVVGGGIVVHDFLQNHVTTGERLDVPTVLKATEQRIVVRHVVSKLTTAALDIRRNDVADRAIGECHGRPFQLNQKRSFMSLNCSSNIERLSCALVTVRTPGVELLTLTAAALAAFAARLADSLFSASSSACRLCWISLKRSSSRRIAFS